MPVQHTCLTCGSSFSRPPSASGIYCSKACHDSRPPLSIAQRFDPKVRRSAGCWEWTGGKVISGYGILSLGKGIREYAHRIAWELATGEPIPPDRIVCHICDEPACVRADDDGWYKVGDWLYRRRGHLWLGDDAANAADKVIKGRCPSGDRHPFRRDPLRAAHGEQHVRAKLTEAQVLAIRARYAAGGITHRELADEYGIASSAVSLIVNRRTWKHLS